MTRYVDLKGQIKVLLRGGQILSEMHIKPQISNGVVVTVTMKERDEVQTMWLTPDL